VDEKVDAGGALFFSACTTEGQEEEGAGVDEKVDAGDALFFPACTTEGQEEEGAGVDEKVDAGGELFFPACTTEGPLCVRERPLRVEGCGWRRRRSWDEWRAQWAGEAAVCGGASGT
jgi:hypothetical protein